MLSQRQLFCWGALSLGFHGLLALAVMYAPAGLFGSDAAPWEPISFEIVEAVDETPEAPAIEETPAVEETPEPEPEELPEAEPRTLPEETPPPVAAMHLPDQTAIDPNPGELPQPNTTIVEVPSIRPENGPANETEDERRRRMAVLLAPSSVARSSFVATGPGPSRPGPPAGLGGGPTGPTEQEIERRLAGGLRDEAMERTWLQRSRPELQRQADGSYTFAGHRFQARIRPDGEVIFNDSGNVQTNGFSASGTWDLTDAIMGGAGQDPHRAEREWFMQHTEELRHRLETEHRRTQMAAGMRGLRGRVVRVWNTTSRSAEARRRRIFDIWDDIAEDDDGARARAIVIAFIRETLPEGGEDAFTERELTRMNANRASEERFEPY